MMLERIRDKASPPRLGQQQPQQPQRGGEGREGHGYGSWLLQEYDLSGTLHQLLQNPWHIFPMSS